MYTYLKGVVNLPRVLSRAEKIGLLVIGLIVLVTIGFWWRDITDHWSVKPVKGGLYSEGLVDTSPQDIDQIVDKLTKIGLTYVDHNNEIKGALADRWQVEEEGKKYIFYLRPNVQVDQIVETYSSLPNWQNIQITPQGDKEVVIHLKQPFAPLLAFASEPVVAQGPYKIERQEKTEILFTANKDFILGEPNIQKILLTFYPDEKAVKAALQRQEIMGADRPIKNISGAHLRKLKLTKQTVLLYNLERATFKDKSIREKIKNNQKLDKPISATLVTTQEPDLLEKANEFVAKVGKLGLNVSIRSVNPIVLQRDILPKDDYDMLLTSINYGYDQDPYPYWHSSQLIEPGKNYAGYNSKEADRLIEEARQTLDQGERSKKYEAFHKILETDMPAIFYPAQTYEYTTSKRLKGIKDGIAAVPADRFTAVWQWYIKAKRQPN